jgi:hypothetical protein
MAMPAIPVAVAMTVQVKPPVAAITAQRRDSLLWWPQLAGHQHGDKQDGCRLNVWPQQLHHVVQARMCSLDQRPGHAVWRGSQLTGFRQVAGSQQQAAVGIAIAQLLQAGNHGGQGQQATDRMNRAISTSSRLKP